MFPQESEIVQRNLIRQTLGHSIIGQGINNIYIWCWFMSFGNTYVIYIFFKECMHDIKF